MTLTLSTASRDAMAAALVGPLDGGTIEIRSGTRPDTPNTAATGTVLATIALADPAFSAGGAGVVNLADPPSVDATASGTATWFRAYDGSAAAVFDGKVTQTGGGGDLELATTAITTGLAVDITGGTITMPVGTAD